MTIERNKNSFNMRQKVMLPNNINKSLVPIKKILLVLFLFFGLSSNKFTHMISGNIGVRGCYKYLYWNCDRGFLSKDKIEDICVFVHTNNVYIFGVSEVDISKDQSPNSEDALEPYKIDNYKIYFPQSWESNGVARIIVYVRNDIKVNSIEGYVSDKDLQHILLDVG